MARSRFARTPVLVLASTVVLVLLSVANRYGFHRDELYFVVAGRQPDWGYVDQPPLTPLLSAGAVELLGVSPWAVRILPALAAGLIVLLAGAIAREFGGGRRAQVLAAAAVAVSWVLGLGHLGSTTTYDVLIWTLISWLVVRILAGGDPRQWLLVGLAAGVGLQNKQLVLLLGLGLLVGMLAARQWGEALRSRWVWFGVLVAVVIWSPNLIWQAWNGFPQLKMGGVIADRSSPVDVLLVVPFQLLLSGPLLAPVLLAGLWWLFRSPAGRRWQSFGWAYLTILGMTLLTQGQFYYPAGLLPVILAAGALTVDSWLGRGQRRLRAAATAIVLVISAASMATISLPVLPPPALARTPIPAVYPEAAEQIGWPELADTVNSVVADLPPDDRARATILTRNYGQAGALILLGADDLPPVHSGHNSFASWGPPEWDRDLVVLVGGWSAEEREMWFGACEQRATVVNAAGVENEEYGAEVWVCPQLEIPWVRFWRSLSHLS